LEASFHGNAEAWFEHLVEAQGADYCAYLDIGTHRIVSVSPELFFRLDGERLETRPMKGTRPRGRRLDEDRRFAADLAVGEKDRAENVMIVDLLRNDMGRVSEVGSVEVPELFAIERYQTVWQMVSGIASRTRAGMTDLFAALFPCGSVTGAPKVRTMQIIRELEPQPRGIYCGSIGWWSPERRAEFSVAIRTAVIDVERGAARYSVGSGITWDSDARDEYEECLAKAAVLSRRPKRFELLESMRLDGEIFLLDEHIERMRDSAEYFGFTMDEDRVRAALKEYTEPLKASEQARKLRLLLSRDGSFRIEHSEAKPSTPVRLGFAREPVDERDIFLYHKTTAREAYERALASRPDCDDVLLWNSRCEITETCYANVVLDMDGTLLTPAWQCGLLAGTLRRRMLEEGGIQEAILTREDALHARRILLINSVRKEFDAVLVDTEISDI
jgi:para-aminobenzoate synthetase/4-amino-4-deoxychorismate lyase